jgi:hypothetical protein
MSSDFTLRGERRIYSAAGAPPPSFAIESQHQVRYDPPQQLSLNWSRW